MGRALWPGLPRDDTSGGHRDPSLAGDETPPQGPHQVLQESGRGLLDAGAPVGAGGRLPRRPPQVCPPLTLFSVPLPDPQSMEKAAAPSVTLIVGCGVSSLTLLMLIIIYVSVWR